jgi:hypothetical protein
LLQRGRRGAGISRSYSVGRNCTYGLPSAKILTWCANGRSLSAPVSN